VVILKLLCLCAIIVAITLAAVKRFFDLFSKSLGKTQPRVPVGIVTEKPESATFRRFLPNQPFLLSIVRAHASITVNACCASIISI
jgi:hypothetical protein